MTTTNWKAFLAEKGAQFKDSHLLSFGDPEQAELENTLLAQGDVLFDLSDTSIIKVSGEDAESFLQNQLTNDIRNISETNHQTSAWCSPKGRIIASFRVFKQQDSYFLTVSSDLLEHVIKKLSMYVMMSKVTIEDATDSYTFFAYAGKEADNNLQTIISKDNDNKESKLASEDYQTSRHKSLSILRISSNTKIPSFQIFGELDDAKQLWEACSVTAKPASSTHFSYLNILAGLPVITEPSSEKWIPQMVNFIAVNGVDFKKGCYPGQEVVARLNYLGKTKRRMYRIEIDTEILPAVNDTISSASDTAAGQILNTALNLEGKVEALAILKIAEAEKQLTLANNKNASITLLELPYSLEE